MVQNSLAILICLTLICYLTEVVRVKRYDEPNLDPPDIQEDEFYYRYTLEHKSRTVEVNKSIPAYIS